MELGEIFQTVWRRLWLIVLGTLAFSLIVFLLSKNMQPVYQAKVTMMVNPSKNAPFVDQASILTGEELALTYSELLKARPLLEIVIANLNLDLSPDDLVADMLGTELIPGTQLLVLTIEDTNAQRASDIANEVAFTFISLHNTEQQFQNIVALEEDVVAQMAVLRQLIERNRAAMDESRLSSGRLTGEELNLIEAALTDQQIAYINLLQTYLNVQLVQAQLLDITVVEPAIAPATPVRPNVLVYTFLGAFVGLVFSVGLTFLVEYLDQSIKTADQVGRVLSLPTLGTIPRLEDKGRGGMLVTLASPLSFAAEAYRTLRTNVRLAGFGGSPATLLITSAEPKLDTTAVTANLGIVCAQAGLKVVLIDTNLRVPRLHHLFGLEDSSGLTDLLTAESQNVQAHMMSTQVENLCLIAGGSIPNDPSELLGSKRMEEVLAQIAENAQLILLDAPPVLAVADAAVLASKADGLILLIEVGRTSQQAARRACEIIRGAGATIPGAVLTEVTMKRSDLAYQAYMARTQADDRRPLWRRLGRHN